jgi:activating signal cointegrator 1
MREGSVVKAITLTQPWTQLVTSGDKRIETRSWTTDYRGPLAIHAAKTIPSWVREWYEDTPAVQTMLMRAGFEGPDDLPLGCVVATCQIVGVMATDRVDRTRLGKERILGNFEPGRYAFYLEDIMRVDPPVPARGQLGLWEWDNEAAGVVPLVTGRLF